MLQSYLLVGIFSLIPAIGWGYFFWRKDFLEPEPFRMVFLSFLAGGMAAGLLLIEKQWLISFVSDWRFSSAVVLFFAVLEEFLKILFLLLCGKFLHLRFSQVIDGAVYGVLAGLGFAFVENMIYFSSVYTGEFSSAFIELFLFRSLGTMLLHGLTTGIFGLFWGYAIFSKHLAPFDRVPMIYFGKSLLENFWNAVSLRILRNHILRNYIPLHGHQKIEIIKEGFVIALGIHFIGNILLDISGFGNTPMVFFIFLLVGVLGIFSRQFMKEKYIKIYEPL